MNYYKYYNEIKKELGIKQLTEAQSKIILSMYITKVPVRQAIEKIKEGLK